MIVSLPALALLTTDDSGAAALGIGFLVIAGIGLLIYFIPSFVAFNKKKSNAGAIFALNLLLGWTLVGWVVSLVWALTQDTPPQQVVVYQQAMQQPAAAPPQPPDAQNH